MPVAAEREDRVRADVVEEPADQRPCRDPRGGRARRRAGRGSGGRRRRAPPSPQPPPSGAADRGARAARSRDPACRARRRSPTRTRPAARCHGRRPSRRRPGTSRRRGAPRRTGSCPARRWRSGRGVHVVIGSRSCTWRSRCAHACRGSVACDERLPSENGRRCPRLAAWTAASTAGAARLLTRRGVRCASMVVSVRIAADTPLSWPGIRRQPCERRVSADASSPP